MGTTLVESMRVTDDPVNVSYLVRSPETLDFDRLARDFALVGPVSSSVDQSPIDKLLSSYHHVPAVCVGIHP
jgi:hypothetical protein